MAKHKRIDVAVQGVLFIGILVLVNVLGIGLFGRLDLTRDHEFTLSDATKKTLADLSDPVTVTAYFTKDLPPPFSTNARYVKDLLNEYYAHSGGNLRYQFVDPESKETAADEKAKKKVRRDIFGREVRPLTSIEKKLRGMGIPAVQVKVDGGDKVEMKRAYMGIAIEYRGEKQVIPVVKDTSGLEYDLTTLIKKVSTKKPPKIALLVGHDGPTLQKGLKSFKSAVSELYDLEPLDLTKKAVIPKDTKALLVVGPMTPLTTSEKRAIDQFVMGGHPAAFLLGPVAPDIKHMKAPPTNAGVTDLLSKWGVTIDPGMVVDAQSAVLTVSEQRGFMRVAQQVHYPFIPVLKTLDANSPVTRGLSRVVLPFASPLTVKAPGGAHAEVLAHSSDKSWVVKPPYDLNPLQKWDASKMNDEGAKPLMVAIDGPLPSAYVVDPATAKVSAPKTGIAKATDARVLVSGSYAFLLDSYMNAGNQALSMNLLDWLMKDDGLLAVRSRGLHADPLKTLTDGERTTVKYANLLGLPLLFIVFGLYRWRRREGRRRKATL